MVKEKDKNKQEIRKNREEKKGEKCKNRYIELQWKIGKRKKTLTYLSLQISNQKKKIKKKETIK